MYSYSIGGYCVCCELKSFPGAHRRRLGFLVLKYTCSTSCSWNTRTRNASSGLVFDMCVFGFVLPLPGPTASESSRCELSLRLPFKARLVPCLSSILVFMVRVIFLSSDIAAPLLQRSSCFTLLLYSLTVLASGVAGCLWSEARDLLPWFWLLLIFWSPVASHKLNWECCLDP